jgi:ABC-type transport system substrate-binding protein
VLRGKKDFHSIPLFMNFSYSINVSKPPGDNVLVRYALNMATDKQAIARLFSAIPAPTFVADAPGYVAPARVDVQIAGKNYDVLAYDPASAR